GGASGCELAVALSRRLGRHTGFRVSVFQGGPRLLPQFPEGAASAFERAFRGRGIEWRGGGPGRGGGAAGGGARERGGGRARGGRIGVRKGGPGGVGRGPGGARPAPTSTHPRRRAGPRPARLPACE